jgi:hypothetical protein
MRVSFACISVLATALLALPALAAEGGLSMAVVVVGKDSPSAPAAIVVGQIARQGFARNPRYSVLDVEASLNGGADGARLATLKRAADALERGQAAYDAFELDPALEALAECVVTYEQALGGLDDTAPLVDALIFQGAAYSLKGDVKNAKSAFTRAFVLNDAATLDGGRFPDTVQALFEEARNETSALPTGALTVYAAPAAAEVWVDGGFRGSAPLTVSDLKVGRHYVRVMRDGYVTFGAAIDVKRGGEETVQATLRPTTSLSSYEDLRTRIAGGDPLAARELASMLKVDQLMVASVELAGKDVKITGTLLDGVGGGVLAESNKAFAFESARFRGDLELWLGENFRKEGSATATTDGTTASDQRYVTEQAVSPPTPGILIAGWVVTALTVVPVLVSLIAGVVALYEWDSYRNQGKVMAQITGGPPTGVPNQITASTNEGRLVLAFLGISAILADISWLVAGGTLATGITLIVLGINEKAEIEDVLARAPLRETETLALHRNAE